MDRTGTVSEPDTSVKAGVSGFSVAALTAAVLALVGVLAWEAVPPGIHEEVVEAGSG